MVKRLCMLSLLLCVTASSFAAEIKLSPVNGDGCVPTYWYNKVFTAKQIKLTKLPVDAIAFAHDNCDGKKLTVGINGESLILPLISGSNDCLSGCSYEAGTTKVFLKRRGLIRHEEPSENNCGGTWWKADITIYIPSQILKIKSTEESSC